MKKSVKTNGTCSKSISYEIIDGKVYNVVFEGGCQGNLKAVGKLVEGQSIKDVVAKLSGITCGSKETSCTDQLAKALSKD